MPAAAAAPIAVAVLAGLGELPVPVPVAPAGDSAARYRGPCWRGEGEDGAGGPSEFSSGEPPPAGGAPPLPNSVANPARGASDRR